MVRHVPQGGNWKNIPESIPSKRLEQIRASGGRTTYYGRLRWDKPSYTVTTYFNRPGNGCYIHPSDGTDNLTQQNRLISFREAARLQSFPDSFVFLGSKTSQYNQIGNAVPPLLAYSIAKQIKGATALDLFCGCGGMSHGFELAGFDVLLGVDIEKHAMNTWAHNHKGKPILGDITKSEVKDEIFDTLAGRAVDIIIGGPPCQGFSTAGWRQDADPRNQLWNDYLAIVERVSPNYFIIENVPGILTAKQNGSTVLENMKLAFGKLGYLLKVKKLKAEEFGIPQLRRRVIIVGHKESVEFQFPEPVTSDPITVKDAIYNLPMLGVSDGIEMLELPNYKPVSLYENWLVGKVSTSEYFDTLRSKQTILLK
ncbi:MAG: DNA (cytosine-5-)-methyltransferase [Methylotenera sp.]|nr:DNA (cytosine-5-)-methyltransferase [Methylotenera sp.]